MSPEERSSVKIRLPARYYIALVVALANYGFDGNTKSFALVMTHVTSTNTSSAEELIFTNCTVFNTSRDMKIEMREDTMFLLYTTYNVAFLVPRGLLCVLASRVSLSRSLGFCLVFSNVLTLCLPFVIQFSIPLLFVSLGVRGALDGSVTPLTLSLLSMWTTDEDKGRLFTISMAGIYLSPAVASLLAMYIMCYVRWDGVLFVFGATGILTGVITLMTVYDTPEEHPSLPRSEVELHNRYRSQVLASSLKRRKVPWRRMLTSLPLWAAIIGYFTCCFIYIILLIGLSQYLMDAFNINIADIGLLSTLPHLGLSILCVLGGVLSDSLLNLGLNVTFTRKLIFTVGHLTGGICLLCLFFVYDWRIAVILLTLGASASGLADAGYLPLASDLAPKYAAETSSLVSAGTTGSIAGCLATSVFSGNYKDVSSWQKIFLTSGFLSIASVLFFDMAASAEVQPWAQETSSEEDTTEKTEFDKLLPEPAKSSSCYTNCDTD